MTQKNISLTHRFPRRRQIRHQSHRPPNLAPRTPNVRRARHSPQPHHPCPANQKYVSSQPQHHQPNQPSLTKFTFSTGERFQPFIVHNINSLRSELAAAAAQGDRARGIKLQMLIATAEGRYDFTQRNLNAAFPGLQVERFAGWFVKKWDLEQGEE